MNVPFQSKRAYVVGILTTFLLVVAGYANAQVTGLTYDPGSSAVVINEAVFSGSGSGTTTDPFVITNCVQLQQMNHDLEANYVLANDIDCSATKNWNNHQGFNPIGPNDNPPTAFNGTLSSQAGHQFTINDVFINKQDSWSNGNVGFIRFINRGAVVKNINFRNLSIQGIMYCMGGLAGLNEGVISNVTLTGVIENNNLYYAKVGGLVGQNFGRIEKAGVDVLVKGLPNPEYGMHIGGLVGENQGDISKSFAKGAVQGEGYIGGFCGKNLRFITDSYSLAHVEMYKGSATSAHFGGVFIGQNAVVLLEALHPAAVAYSYAADPMSVDPEIYPFNNIVPPNAWNPNDLNKVPANTVCLKRNASDTACKTMEDMRERSAYVPPSLGPVFIPDPTGVRDRVPSYITPIPDWDFAGTWKLFEGRDVPHLQWENYPKVVSLTTDPASQFAPAIDGNMTAYVDRRRDSGAKGDIYVYNFLTGKERRVTDDAANADQADISGTNLAVHDIQGGVVYYDLVTGQRSLVDALGNNPRISGNYIVYTRSSDSAGFLYDIRSGQPTPIPVTVPADISGNNIVWRSGNDLKVYNILDGSQKTIAAVSMPLAAVSIDNDNIVWVDVGSGGAGADIYSYNIATQLKKNITDDPAVQDFPSVSGDWIIWQDARSGNPEVYGFDVTVNKEYPLTKGSVRAQNSPVVSNDRVVWANGAANDPNRDLYMMDLKFDRQAVKLTVIPAGTGAGHITSAPYAFNCSNAPAVAGGLPADECEANFDKGTNVMLYLSPDERSKIGSVDSSGLSSASRVATGSAPIFSPYVLSMGGESRLAVNYMLKPQYPLTVQVQGAGVVTGKVAGIGVSAPYNVYEGTEIVLLAQPGAGTVFKAWTGTPPGVCTGSSCTLIINSAMTVTAQFAVDPAEITKAFLELLGRAPSAQELTLWGASGKALTQIRQEIAGGPEVAARTTIVGYYRDLLKRAPDVDGLGVAPDGGGLKYWMDQFRAGTSLEAIRNSFLNSQEYKDILAAQLAQSITVRGEVSGKVRNQYLFNSPLANQRVDLINRVNNQSVSVTSDPQGSYRFGNLIPGDYRLVVVKRMTGYRFVRRGWFGWRVQSYSYLQEVGSSLVTIPQNGGVVARDLFSY